jgi:hypothetical protein
MPDELAACAYLLVELPRILAFGAAILGKRISEPKQFRAFATFDQRTICDLASRRASRPGSRVALRLPIQSGVKRTKESYGPALG